MKKELKYFSLGVVTTLVITSCTVFAANSFFQTNIKIINNNKSYSADAIQYKNNTYVNCNSLKLLNTNISFNSKTKTISIHSSASSASRQQGVTFGNAVIKSEAGMTTVEGEVTNHDKSSHTFTLTVTFYDSNKKLLGTAMGTVNDIAGGATKTFQAMATGDYSKAASYKIDVDTMVQ